MVKKRNSVKTIELYHENTGEVKRLIRCKDPKGLKKFLDDFNSMRYPGYGWRFREYNKRKKSIKKI